MRDSTVGDSSRKDAGSGNCIKEDTSPVSRCTMRLSRERHSDDSTVNSSRPSSITRRGSAVYSIRLRLSHPRFGTQTQLLFAAPRITRPDRENKDRRSELK